METITETRLLQVGDRLYRTYGGTPNGFTLTIVHLTRTQAIANNGSRFAIELNKSGWAREIPAPHGWGSDSYYIETDKLKDTVKAQKLATELSRKNWLYFSTDTLQKITDILEAEAAEKKG